MSKINVKSINTNNDTISIENPENDTLIGTGMTLILTDNRKIFVIVKSELNGDGQINEEDFNIMLRYIQSGDMPGGNQTLYLELDREKAKELFERAGKVTAGERLDIEDLMAIREIISEYSA
jgi:hypothetical protein